ncbi:MAG: hypothetical protein ACK4WM_11040 [Thermoflexales bacterium]
MMRLLTFLLSLLDRLFRIWEEARLRQEGRERLQKEMDRASQQAVEKAERAVSVPDPERDERLRSRFDRSRRSE